MKRRLNRRIRRRTGRIRTNSRLAGGRNRPLRRHPVFVRPPPALFSCRRRHTLPHGLPLLPPPAVSWSRHTLTGRAAHGSPPRRPQTPAGDPPLAARPFLLPSPSHPSARPPILLQPAFSRSRHTLTGRAAHGSPPRRPQTPAGGPPLAARPFLLPSPSHPSARPPILLQPAFSRSRHTLTGRAAHGSPPRRPQTPAGGPPLAARPFLLPSPSPPSARPPAFATARRFLLPAPRALSGSRADGGFFMRAQGFARACGILLI